MANAAETVDPGDREARGAVAADENAELVAELEAELGGKPAKPAGKAKPAAKPAVKPEPAADEDAGPADDEAPADDEDADNEEGAAAESGDEDDSEDEDADELEDDEAEADEEPDEDDELDAEAAKDPETKKRWDALRRTAQRQRERFEQERTTFDRERTAWQTETRQVRDAVERIRALAARAKLDPISLLEAHGLGQDDMEFVAQQAYARSKAAAAKPEYRAAAERAQRERELAETANANAKRLAELEAKLEGKDSQAQVERELDAYFGRAFRKVTDATPITARLIAKRPKAAREELQVTAAQLSAKLGRLPKVAELLAAHEKREVRALKLRGIKPPTPGAGKPAVAAPAEAGKPAAAKPGAKPAKAAIAAVDDDIPSTADLVRELAEQSN